ncbi:MAG: glycosyltransferase family 39 protein [Salibacteraceae bacterium]
MKWMRALLFFGVIGLLVAIKAPTMDLPHYWDEAYPYSYAIGHMTENGPGILTTAAPAIYTTGHPLLYYFLQACWNAVVGESMWLQRIFPLLISIATLFMTFLLGKALFNEKVGLGAAVILVCQNAFLANATFQLPEMLLTLLLLSTLYFLISERKILFTTSAVLMLFVKEPAVVLLFFIFIFHFFVLLRKIPLKKRFGIFWMYAIPVVLNLAFYLHQYAVQGWFLFPRHTGFMTFTSDFFFNQLSRYFAHLFIYSGRNALFFGALALLVFYLFKQRRHLALSKQGIHAIFLGLIMLGFLLFSAFNFYSNRYILCLFPLFVLLGSMAVYLVFEKRQWVFWSGVLVMFGTSLFFSIKEAQSSDRSLGYANGVIVQMNAVTYCLENFSKDTPIQTGFLMSKNLTCRYPGYISRGEEFTRVNISPLSSSHIFIESNNEKLSQEIKASINLRLIKSFDKNGVSCKVFQNADIASD